MKEIRESKHDYFENLDRQLSSVNDDSKLFRKTSKQVLNLDKSSSCVTTLKLYNEFAENNQAKAEMLNLYFVSQTRVDSTHKVFNRSIDQGYYPYSWKEASVSPILKKMMTNPFQTFTDLYLSVPSCKGYGRMHSQTFL